MKKLKLIFIIQLYFLFVFCFGNDVVEYYQNEATKYGFKLVEKVEEPKQLNIRKLSKKELIEHWNKLFELLKKYDIDFKRFKINSVSMVKSIKHNGDKHFGYKIKNDIYLTEEWLDFVFFHEIYHIVDDGYNNDEWEKLNNKRFKYSDRPSKKFVQDFVREYSQTDIKEDKADVFAILITNGKKFLERHKNNMIMNKKIKFIINETIENNLVSKEFWEKHLEIKID